MVGLKRGCHSICATVTLSAGVDFVTVVVRWLKYDARVVEIWYSEVFCKSSNSVLRASLRVAYNSMVSGLRMPNIVASLSLFYICGPETDSLPMPWILSLREVS